MKLLFVLPEYLPQTGGGIITYYAALLPALVAAGHEVRVIQGSAMVSAPGGGVATIDGIEVETLDAHRVEKYLPAFARYRIAPKLQRSLAAAWALWEQAQGHADVDVVEATDWGLLFVPWVLQPGPPVAVALHGSMGQIARHDPLDGEQVADALIQLIEVLGLSAAAGVQTYSSANVAAWQELLGRPVRLVRPVWPRPTLPAPVGERTDRGLVVGRVQYWKGPQVLCEALRLLGDRAPGIDWIGRDVPIHQQGGSTARHMANTWPDVWGSRIRHLAGEPPARIHDRQRTTGFVVVPSLWDVFNFTCVESMAAAAPVVCSAGAGASDLIEPGVSGFVAAADDAQSLADQIDRLLSLGPPARRALGEAGAETIGRALASETVLPARLDFYRSLFGRIEPARVPNEWFAAACTPDPKASSLDAALAELPLRTLMRHVLERVRGRLGLAGTRR